MFRFGRSLTMITFSITLSSFAMHKTFFENFSSREQFFTAICTNVIFAHDFFCYLTDKEIARCREISKNWYKVVDAVHDRYIDLFDKCGFNSFPIYLSEEQLIKETRSDVLLLKTSITLSPNLKKIYGIMQSQQTIDNYGLQTQQPVYEFCTFDFEVNPREILNKQLTPPLHNLYVSLKKEY
jgi:hypothetical protein